MPKNLIFAAILALGALMLDAFSLSVLYKIYWVEDPRDFVALLLAVSTIVKIVTVFLVTNQRGRDLSKALFILFTVAVAFLLMNIGPLRGMLRFELWPSSMFPVAIGSAVVFVFTFIAWLNFSGAINRHHDDLRGYRSILHAAGLAISLPMVLVFFKAPILFGHLLFDVGLLACSWSMLAPMRPALTMHSQRKKTTLYSLFITTPLALYFGPFILGILGFVVEHRAEISDAIRAPETEFTAVDDPQQFLSQSLSEYQRIGDTQLFRDVHYFNDGRVCAIDEQYFYCQQDGSMARRSRFDQPVNFLRFDQTGQRGLAQGDIDAYFLTNDGGESWWALNPGTIHAEQSGIDSDIDAAQSYSPVHVDLKNGKLSFVIQCHYYQSDDFGANWQMVRPKDDSNKVLCVADTPYAVDIERGMAAVQVEQIRVLFVRDNESNHWTRRCAIRRIGLFMQAKPVNRCSEQKYLSTAEAQFIEREKRFVLSANSELLESHVIDQLVAGKSVDSDVLNKAVRTQGTMQWIAQDHVWLSSDKGTDRWRAHVVLPNIAEIYPLDASRAFARAYDDSSNHALYYSDDAGVRWHKVLVDDDEDHKQIKFNPGTNSVWLLTSRRVLKFGGEQPLKPVSTELPVTTSAFFFSSDDASLVIVDESQLHYTKDLKSWRMHEINDAPKNAAYKDDYGDIVDGDVISLDCKFDNALACIVGYSNATAAVLHIDLDTNQLHEKVLSAIPAKYDDDEFIAHIRILNGPRYIVIPEGRSTGYEMTDGDSKWTKLALNDFSEWASVTVLPDQQSLLAVDYYNDFLVITASGEVKNINAESWAEGVGYCIDAAGGHMVMFDYTGNIAVSTDQQHSWSSTKSTGFENPACGFNQNYLWLQHSQMTIFKR